MSEKLIPLYCLTGFVGSGKTTALLSILKQNPGKKIGVIFTEPSIFKSHDLMNEEDISIEHLENGSLQCSCSEDAIVRALHFMQQCQPEMVFIEVAGLSDPIHIKHILEQERTAPNSTLLTEHYEMQGIICLVDADNFMEQIQDVEMIRLQLCHCHLAVINKADLVSPELLTAIKAQIRRINPDCDISSCSYGGFSLELLENDLLSHSTDEGEQDLPAELRPDSIVLNCIHRLPREKVIAFIKQFVPETYRIKGFCLFEDGWNQVDVVGSRISFSRCMPHSSSRLIFISKIGHALSEPIRQSWNDCSTFRCSCTTKEKPKQASWKTGGCFLCVNIFALPDEFSL